MKALHFGGGNIGRGFIGKILAEAGYEVVFADINMTVIDRLNQDHGYTVHVVGEGVDQKETVKNVRGINSGDEAAVTAEISDATLVTTAVGPPVLEILAPLLARSLAARYRAGGAPLNIIACENMVRGSSFLKEKVLTAAGDDAALIDANTGFVDCAVDRIVPPVRGGDADPLAVTVEVFSEWIVDSTQFKGAVPAIAGMIATDKLMAFIERKLFTLNTGHTALAYFGQLAGKKTVGEAMQDDAVRQAAEAVMKESGAVLIRRYAFDPAAHRAYIDKILKRFANPYLHDDIDRVARQPLRKLGAQERFIKPLNGMLEYDLPHDATVRAIAATLHYHNPDDPQAVEMQYYRQAHGIAATLVKYSDFDNTAVVAKIEAAYQAL
ncbi:Mannitol-1-phosphate 5-dehydrogenase [Cardiobacterium hominis]|uniref:Mannitol-1-phosphate 5-dehydrogenase n=1 Tax=Cardiobacterium hominis (strain ATCC 15826 / DSM 8339 / NCTC 10426 / 6573) TaxID=638300 RepID=C8NBS2_CARH6|nr:mannitol-1-phosphate 5-dehydrogenase [Cardiobacterium hominis]EEV87910.1 mannitol dehydrogenase domain protein [Cardiobacterium hominis ATCC 15826]VEG77735.1 Mannitol-1-phosphate 5-dehydrogenase [Cardiobacterium hominis]